MPSSRSFPSGHTAAAFAFATGVGHASPAAAVPLRALAALVGYSRVHTGVHYPGDVIAGALIGTAFAQLTAHMLARRSARRQQLSAARCDSSSESSFSGAQPAAAVATRGHRPVG